MKDEVYYVEIILDLCIVMGITIAQAAPYSQNYPNQSYPSQNQYNNQSSNRSPSDTYVNQPQRQSNTYYNDQYRDSSNYNSDNSDQQNDDSNLAQDQAATGADRRINDKIREKITGWFTDKYKKVNLNTNNGVVTIVGVVKNNDDLNTLVLEIRKVDGVRNINNNVNVSDVSDSQATDNSKYPQDRAATDADRRLNDKIRSKIAGWFTDSYKQIVLNTTNGNVIITGVVAKVDDLNKLQNEIRKIDGVRNVTNNAQVRN